MIRGLYRRRYGPIGVDISSRAVKLLQLTGDRSAVHEAACWDLPVDTSGEAPGDGPLIEALRRAREGRNFRGRDAVLCLGAADLFVQNVRVPLANGEQLQETVRSEAAGRLPFSSQEAEIRFLEAGDVRQGDSMRHEVILLACHRPVLERMVAVAEEAGLRPLAVDAEPVALLRSYARQFRRDEDRQRRTLYVSVGASTTKVIIARGSDAVFVKYIDAGGRHLDEAVAHFLEMPPAEAEAVRRHNGDRRADRRDPEVARSVQEAVRPVLDRVAHEVSLCMRYYSVTFRGQPLSHGIVGGGEATEAMAEWLAARLDLPFDLGNPLRCYAKTVSSGRPGQWDVAAGLALREIS